ncbi:MAG TPA: GerW family sporulation protein [Acetivibrio sp.]|uniref:GerW family sporulation protein n=1 Tax=Acetivibrio sp. TaxID=1872092 RepID=UPI002B97B8B2|nr:GerW family sporulation protein [Acetivibrio sp.]HOM01782.1 GerW family sporulation protein [Acetivibrio sp.]
MAEHPIQGLMATAMESIKEMVDVNTIVGDAVQAPDGTVIIPISKVTFGFAAGGGEFASRCTIEKKDEDSSDDDSNKPESKFPFAGGSGAGVSINPVAFMVVGQGQIKLLPVNINSSLEKVLDLIPEIIEKAKDSVKKNLKVKKEIKPSDVNAKCAKEDEDE